jgi:hypothetical protein
MSKLSFKKDIQEFERNGGSMSFTFGETKLPVIYREALNLLCVQMPTTEVFIPVDYRLVNRRDRFLIPSLASHGRCPCRFSLAFVVA